MRQTREESLPSPVSVRSEHYQIRPPLFGLIEDRLLWMAIDDARADLEFATVRGKQLFTCIRDSRLSLLFSCLLHLREITLRKGPCLRCWNVGKFDYRDNSHLAIRRKRPCSHLADRGIAPRGSVHCHQYLHDYPPF